MFNSGSLVFLIIGIVASLILIVLCTQQYSKHHKQFYAKRLMTAYECKMYLRLKQAFPEYHILSQVAFSALITSDQLKIRNQFNRKVTDFVLLDEQLAVVMIIELDDRSHIGKEQIDAERDAMLNEAGYRVLRYTEIPSIRQLQKNID